MLYIGSRDEIMAIDLSKVAYIKAEGYYSRFSYADGTSIMVSMGIGRLEKMLQESDDLLTSDFIRTNRSHIINIRLVVYVSFSKSIIRLTDEMGASCVLNLSKNELRFVANHLVSHKRVLPISPDTPQKY